MVTKDPTPLDIPLQTITLEKLRIAAAERLSPSVLHSLRLDTMTDVITGDLLRLYDGRLVHLSTDGGYAVIRPEESV